MLNNFNRELELLDGIESDFVKILYYDFSQKYTGKYKSYGNSRLCTILDGEKKVSIDNKTNFTYDKNKFVLLPPNSNVQMNIEKPTKALVFEINNDLIKKINSKVSIDYEIDSKSLINDKVFLGSNIHAIGASIEKILRFSTGEKKNNIEFLMDLYAQELVYNLVHIKGVNGILNMEFNDPISNSIKYMNENYKLPLSLKELASNFNMSEANFSQKFKKIIGISPKEYFTNLKLTKAKKMLKDRNVTDLAFELGYENISHFIKLFKGKYNITPKQYKMENGI